MSNLIVKHPYYPKKIKIPHYVPNTISDGNVLASVALVSAAILSLGLIIFRLAHKGKPSKGDIRFFAWFFLCGFIHLFLEGYFVVYNQVLAADNWYLGQVWKHYSLADSRYLTSDSCVLVVEAITSFLWGPLSFYAAYCIASDSPHRHIVQLIISLGQIYGDVLYYLTTLIEGAPHSRPEPLYFWGYFIIINAIWIIVPFLAMVESCSVLVAFAKRGKEAPGDGPKKKLS